MVPTTLPSANNNKLILTELMHSPEETQGFLFFRTLGRFLIVYPIGHRRHAHQDRFCSATQIDAVVQQIARDALKQAIDLLTPRRPLMDALVEALIEQETLDEISFNKIVQAHEKDFSPQQPLAQCSPHPQR